jgi:cell division protein FtsW
MSATAAAVEAVHFRERWRMGVEARALVLLTATILAFGLATLYSASAIVAIQDGLPSAYFLLRQLSGVLVGVVAFAVAAKVDAGRLERLAWPIMALAILTMLLTVLPFTEGIAPRINGSRRFLLGGSLQPSEFAKLAVVVWTAMLAVKKGEQGLRRLSKGLLPFLLVVGTLDVLAVLEPDLSAAMMFTLMMAVILFAAGARIGHFVFLAVLGIPVLWSQVQKLQYTLLRMTSFFDAGSAPEVSYQLQQSLIAVGSGGLFGFGFGQGRQQYGFVPFGYNDFIGSTIGEEWGFVGIAALVAVYAAWGFLGFRIAAKARTPFLRLVAVGLTFTMIVTAYLHVGVVIGLLPTTGLTLPFVSYGRSNLVLSLVMTGVLVNVGSVRERVYNDGATDPTAYAPAAA